MLSPHRTLEDIEANAPNLVNVWVVDARQEPHFGRCKGEKRRKNSVAVTVLGRRSRKRRTGNGPYAMAFKSVHYGAHWIIQ